MHCNWCLALYHVNWLFFLFCFFNLKFNFDRWLCTAFVEWPARFQHWLASQRHLWLHVLAWSLPIISGGWIRTGITRFERQKTINGWINNFLFFRSRVWASDIWWRKDLLWTWAILIQLPKTNQMWQNLVRFSQSSHNRLTRSCNGSHSSTSQE